MSIYYRPIHREVQTVQAADKLGLPILLKGPTGCGKTRFVRHMAERLGRSLITVLCQEDLTASDLTGRYLIKDRETYWHDGPLTRGVREGAIVYLDEVVEARSDVLSLIHALTDDRRTLHLERTGEAITAPTNFMLMVSYNPNTHSLKKTLNTATQQRFVSLKFDYPEPIIEIEIVQNEAKCDEQLATKLVEFGQATRRLHQIGLHHGASTRCLINAARLCGQGFKLDEALKVTLVDSLTDDPNLRDALLSIVNEVQ
jgi:nitric oxide reductase NorQ protein